MGQSERRDFLRRLLHERRILTVQEAWDAGHEAGLFTGGEAREIRAGLNVIGRYHDGWCRLDKEPERQRRAVRYADYWTSR